MRARGPRIILRGLAAAVAEAESRSFKCRANLPDKAPRAWRMQCSPRRKFEREGIVGEKCMRARCAAGACENRARGERNRIELNRKPDSHKRAGLCGCRWARDSQARELGSPVQLSRFLSYRI